MATSLVFSPLRSVSGALFGYETFRMPGRDMQPSLQAGDVFVADPWRYRREKPARGAIAAFSHPQTGRTLMKRVVGLPGETVAIKERVIFIDGAVLDERYVDPASDRNDLTLPFGTLKLGADEYYLLGDNRDSSEDSRFFGAVPLSSFQGRGEFLAFSYDSASGLRVERIGRRLR